MNTTAWLDADMLVWRAVEKALVKGFFGSTGEPTNVLDFEKAKRGVMTEIDRWMQKAGANDVVLAFTSPKNYRKLLTKTYNRKVKAPVPVVYEETVTPYDK